MKKNSQQDATRHNGVDLHLRPARIEDCMELLRWRNHPTTRKASFSTKTISLNEHKEWLTKSLRNPTRHIFIVVFEEKSVGSLRVDVDGSNAEVHVAISPEYRGKGLGTKAVSLALTEASKMGLKSLIAKVRPENSVSVSLFEKLGFIIVDRSEGILTLRKVLN